MTKLETKVLYIIGNLLDLCNELPKESVLGGRVGLGFPLLCHSLSPLALDSDPIARLPASSLTHTTTGLPHSDAKWV